MKKKQEDNDGTVITNELPSNEYLLAIGKFVVTFSRLEELVVTIMALLFGCEPEAIANVAYSLDMNSRCQALRGIMAYRFGSRDKSDQGLNLKQDEDIKKITEIFKKVFTATEKRNLLVHSSWHGDTKTGLAHRMSPKGRQITGYPGGDITLVRLSDIEEDTNFINQTIDELWKYFWDNFGSWVLERAKNNENGLHYFK